MEKKKLVTVYTQPDCRPCRRVIKKLEEAGIELEVVDLSKDLLAKDYVQRVLRVSSTPIVEAFGFPLIVGYQPDKLKEFIHEVRIEQNADEIHDYVYGDEE